jgi:hypothetical protein
LCTKLGNQRQSDAYEASSEYSSVAFCFQPGRVKNSVAFSLPGEKIPVPKKATPFLFRFMSTFEDESIEFPQK